MAKTKPMRGSLGTGNVDIGGMNLSDEEKAQYKKASNKGPRITTAEGTVSQKAHEDAINKLKEKIASLEKKNEDLKKEIGTIRGERDDYKKRFESKITEVEKLESEKDTLKEANRQLSDRIEELKGSLKRKAEEAVIVRDDAEVERLGKEVAGLKDKLKESEDKAESLESENASLKSRISELESETESADGLPAATESLELSGSVRRSTPTRFESDLFIDRRYLVRLARNGRTISFTPHVEGAATCIDGAIELPRMKELVPFQGITEYEAIVRDGSEILVILC